MDLTVGGPPLQLQWHAPAQAKLVACGLFRCVPEFATRSGDSESDHTPTGGPLRFIANADACVVSLEATDANRVSFSFDAVQSPPHHACETETVFVAPVQNLSVGCWAYDDSRIIAASELVPIEPLLARPLLPTIPVDASCLREHDACYDPIAGFFGACVAGTCQPRCRAAVDCELAASQYFHLPHSDTCSWACDPVSNSSAGVCRPN